MPFQVARPFKGFPTTLPFTLVRPFISLCELNVQGTVKLILLACVTWSLGNLDLFTALAVPIVVVEVVKEAAFHTLVVVET